jgi:hypothetical protein
MQNQNQFESSRYWRTTSFYTACYLYAKGQVLVNVDRISDTRRSQFVFLDSPERELLVRSFNYADENDSEVLVDVRTFVTAIKQLKDKLYQDDFGRG